MSNSSNNCNFSVQLSRGILYLKCPKCGYIRGESDAAVMPGVCPHCGIAYNKWKRKAQFDSASSRRSHRVSDVSQSHPSIIKRCLSRLLEQPEQISPAKWWMNLVVYGCFFLWGWSFILGGIDWETIGSSFLHNVNLPFHEFGHVLFRPFGNFMMILGGSLFQLMMPLGLLIVFIFKRRDTFAASIMLWWSGQNFIDISPYIADARSRALPLIRGASESYHDWGNLLTMTGKLEQTEYYAGLSFSMGVLLILLSLMWGGWLVVLQYQQLRKQQ